MREEIRNIGFNEQIVSVSGRSLHVQTEVAGMRTPVIRSVVLDGGIVRHLKSHPFPVDVEDLGFARSIIESQHREVVKLVTTGQIR
jgi:hypothetical protein